MVLQKILAGFAVKSIGRVLQGSQGQGAESSCQGNHCGQQVGMGKAAAPVRNKTSYGRSGNLSYAEEEGYEAERRRCHPPAEQVATGCRHDCRNAEC